MRLHIKIKTKKRIPFNYQPALTGAIHKWIGKNEVHDKISMYSFSWLKGGSKSGDGLIFEDDTSFELSAHDSGLIKSIIKGIQSDPVINYGLEVCEIVILDMPKFSNKETFFVASPVLVKRTEKESETHFTYDQLEADELLTETMKTKLKRAGLDYSNIQLSFDRRHYSAKTKLVYYKNIGNKTSICPVIIEGTSDQIAFAWNVGVGNSTGIGFGALK